MHFECGVKPLFSGLFNQSLFVGRAADIGCKDQKQLRKANPLLINMKHLYIQAIIIRIAQGSSLPIVFQSDKQNALTFHLKS